MTVYLFHVVEEKTQKSLFFCKFEETFKEQSFRIHSVYSSCQSKIEDKGKDEPADPDSQESWSNNCCWQSLARKSREISFLPVLSRGCYFVGERFRKLRARFILDLGSCPVKTSIAPRGISSKNLLTNLVARAAEFRSCKGYFPPGAAFEPAL